MSNAAAVLDFDSTLIRRGTRATTMSEMQLFVDAIQTRPLDKLLTDLPGLAKLSDMKFILAKQVLRRRLKALNAAEREQLRIMADEVAGSASVWLAERIKRIFS
jgi:phosphoserine phosphatase